MFSCAGECGGSTGPGECSDIRRGDFHCRVCFAGRAIAGWSYDKNTCLIKNEENKASRLDSNSITMYSK